TLELNTSSASTGIDIASKRNSYSGTEVASRLPSFEYIFPRAASITRSRIVRLSTIARHSPPSTYCRCNSLPKTNNAPNTISPNARYSRISIDFLIFICSVFIRTSILLFNHLNLSRRLRTLLQTQCVRSFSYLRLRSKLHQLGRKRFIIPTQFFDITPQPVSIPHCPFRQMPIGNIQQPQQRYKSRKRKIPCHQIT